MARREFGWRVAAGRDQTGALAVELVEHAPERLAFDLMAPDRTREPPLAFLGQAKVHDPSVVTRIGDPSL
jgi:hypothetical protein